MRIQLYASLVGPLIGAYFPMPKEISDEETFKRALNESSLKKLWCAVYNHEETVRQIEKYGGVILAQNNLDYPCELLEEAQ